MKKILFAVVLSAGIVQGDNQTADISPVLVDAPLPFSIRIELADFTLPAGIQSAACAQCNTEYLFIAGRTNGLHGFDNNTNNFPPSQQNSTVFVVNPITKTVTSRSLYDPASGLSQEQIDTLSVTSPQFYQNGNMLYITGGYGVDTATGIFSTKDTLTAVNVSGLIQWVNRVQGAPSAAQCIRQIKSPTFKVTGGRMVQVGENPMLLVFGQDFQGFYIPGANDGTYTKQVRRFRIIDDGRSLQALIEPATHPDPNYRRRDLNVIPLIEVDRHNKKTASYVALSGVFTESFGMWTVPVEIAADGSTYMPNPNIENAFKQGMNIYNCAHAEMLSKCGSMYIVLFGGITFASYQDGQFVTDSEFPFTNQITVIQRTTRGEYTQILLPVQYPTILSTASNPGSTLLFGTGAKFMPALGIPIYSNGVLSLEKIKRETVIGYIIGGIQSTRANTVVQSDSAASPYIFKVILSPH